MLDDRSRRPLLTRLAHEVSGVSRAEGVRLEGSTVSDPDAFLPDAAPSGPAARSTRWWRTTVARRSRIPASGATSRSAKRATEVDAQLGPVVEIGRRNGVATPITAALTALIHAIEDGERTLDRANLDVLAAVAS